MGNEFANLLFESLDRKKFVVPDRRRTVNFRNLTWIERHLPLDYYDRTLVRTAIRELQSQ